jgi:hypothetical protein
MFLARHSGRRRLAKAAPNAVSFSLLVPHVASAPGSPFVGSVNSSFMRDPDSAEATMVG